MFALQHSSLSIPKLRLCLYGIGMCNQQPYMSDNVLQTMELVCGDTDEETCQGCKRQKVFSIL